MHCNFVMHLASSISAQKIDVDNDIEECDLRCGRRNAKRI